jgi:ribonuclease HIII
MVQGKEMRSFIEFYLEPEILQRFDFTHQDVADETLQTGDHIGIDESGKGDFFGPLCIAGVYAKGEEVLKLKSLGVKDSKKLSDATILKVGRKIQAEFQHHIVKINPEKYNELYANFKNLNSLLAWGHATTIEQMVAKTHCHRVIVDQFAAEWVVKKALERKKMEVELQQRHRAEEDLIVAAASILARQAFLEGLEQLCKRYDQNFPKGASAATIEAGRTFVRNQGRDQLVKVGKLHFKTTEEVLR